MYTSFTIRNYRGFKELQFDNLARVNLIAGENNVGKTSVLEAMMLHSHFLSHSLLFRLDHRYYSLPNMFHWRTIFHAYDTENRIQFAGRGSAEFNRVMEIRLIDIASEPGLEGDIRLWIGAEQDKFFRPAQALKFTEGQELYYLVRDASNQIRLIGVDVLPYSAEFITAYENTFLKDTAFQFSELTRKRKADKLLQVLQVIEPRLKDLDLLYSGDIPLIYGDIGFSEPVPLISMGEGINRIASLILAIANASDGVVAIDEIENGLHYSVMSDVWKAIHQAAVEFNVQIFATTHSLECINAAHEAFLEQASHGFLYHRLDRKQSGEIQAVTFNQQELEIAKDANLEVR